MNTALREGVGLPRTFPPPPFANAAKDAPLPASFQALLRFSAHVHTAIYRSGIAVCVLFISGLLHEGGCRVAATRWAPGTWRSGSRVGHEARQPRCALPGGADPAGSRGISGCGGCSCARGRSFQKGKRLHHRGNPYFFHCSFITRLSACSTLQKQLTVTVPK